MKHHFIYIIFALLIVSGNSYSQQETINKSKVNTSQFVLRGEVLEAESHHPIQKVNIEIRGGSYTTTNNAGEFSISARIGDEITIRSDAFETVYYTVKDQQKVTVQVAKTENDYVSSRLKKRVANQNVFISYIDSAKYFLKKDAKKSIEFISKSLESIDSETPTALQNTMAFETLGDINLYWKQFDLAIDNYKQSLTTAASSSKINIKLASAFTKNKNYQESISLFKEVIKRSLSSYQEVEVYEGLGDAYKFINQEVKSVYNYQKGLDIAKTHSIIPKITDLNSKIAETYAQSGAADEAETYFDNSLQLAEKENTQRAVEEKNKVADFYGQNQNFDKEIQLREEALDDINEMESEDSSYGNDSPITQQRQNYKIANAFIAQDKLEEAIPYLNKSIAEADTKKDLIVKKDATRKLSELYKNIGDYDNATKSYEKYVDIVDELYIKKEQEISQATRFSRDIALKQNRITSLENERKLNQSRYNLAVKNKELTNKNSKVQSWIIASLILIALLLLFTAYSQHKSVKQQKYANNLLALKSLRTQMNPHFIFNALNSVNSFIAHNDERAANKYLSEFSQLMRSVLENSEEDFIALEKEIELLEIYVKLEHFRFKDKFDYTLEVDETINLNEYVIPPMLLQPYIENAVWHGLRYKKEKGLFQIKFQKIDEESIKILIIDNGIGREKSKALKTENQKKQQSKGMGNIKKRISILNTMYQDKVDVTITNVSENGEGTQVELILKKD